MDIKVTVLIPSYNPGPYLREALESVFQQTTGKWTVIIVDDASTDDSLSNIVDYIDDPRVIVIQNDENIGQSKSMNRGLELVSTPYLMQLDSDDWLLPDALEVLLAMAQKQPHDVAIFTGNVNHVYENIWGEKKIVHRKTIKTSGRSFEDRYEILLSNYIPYPRFFRTAALKQIGGWPVDDPYEGRHVEDLKIFLRLLEHYSFYWIDHTLYNYRKHANNSTKQRNIIAEMVEWTIRDALKRWGDEYEPIFKVVKGGWKLLDRLDRK